MKIYIVLVLFFLITGFFIISQENIHITDSEELGEFFDSYGSWVFDLINSSRNLAGYFVKMEWLPNYTETRA